MTRIAIAGTGSMARIHALAFQSVPDAFIVAVLGRDTGRTAAFAAEFGAVPYTNLDLLLSEAPCDVLDCCVATPGHRETVVAAAARGRHVITEKPLALNLADAEAMIEACRVAGVHLLVGHVLRFEPEFRALSAAVSAGNIGTPVSANFLRQGFYPTGRDEWYGDSARSGGIFVDLLIHDFDWALARFGPAKCVFAKLVDHQDAPRFAQGMAILRHSGGVISMITGTWGYPGDFTVAVELVGTGGLLRLHSDQSRPLVFRRVTEARHDAGVALPDLNGTSDPYRLQLAHFLDVIARRAEPEIQPEESLAALRVALAAVASSASGLPQIVEDTQT